MPEFSAISILSVGDLLLVSIPPDLTDDEVVHLQDNILQRVHAVNCSGLALDISSVDIVDSFMARVLNDLASMVGLLGTQVVICGMQPAVALTLAEMGRELVGVRTTLDLEEALYSLGLRRVVEERNA